MCFVWGDKYQTNKLLRRAQLTAGCWQKLSLLPLNLSLSLSALPPACLSSFLYLPPWLTPLQNPSLYSVQVWEVMTPRLFCSLSLHPCFNKAEVGVLTENLIDSQKYKHSQLLFNVTEWEPIQPAALANATKDRRRPLLQSSQAEQEQRRII